MVRIASFNVENLFQRPKAFNNLTWAQGEPIVKAYEEVNKLFQKANYSAADKQRMIILLQELGIYYTNTHGAVRRSTGTGWAWMRKNRGDFDREPQDVTLDVEITATGRGSWIGWVELEVEPVNEQATRMTATVIRDVQADIIGIVEAENRPSLIRFNKEAQLLNNFYEHIMLVDGNDERGIDVGIMTRSGFTIESIRSNVDNRDNTGIIFSRDCPQYEVRTPGGTTLHVLVNHFKSQSGGGGPKRLRQATEVRRIVDALVSQGKHVIVMGDLNEGPKAGATQAVNLAPLYDNNSPLVDCYSLPAFNVGNRPGSWQTCSLGNRLDYIFISKSLQPKFVSGEVYRMGLWGERASRPTEWVTYPQMTQSIEQASDHSALFIDLNI